MAAAFFRCGFDFAGPRGGGAKCGASARTRGDCRKNHNKGSGAA